MKRKTRSEYHHGDLRAALVREAGKVVAQEGPDAVSLRGVAKAAGVSQAAPYHHFKDKQALLSAVAAEGFRQFTETMLGRAGDADDPRDRLNKLGLGYVEFAVRNPSLFRLMHGPTFQGENVNDDLFNARNESFAPLLESVTGCLPGADETKIMSACAAAWSLVHGMATLSSDGRLCHLIDVADLEKAVPKITHQLAIDRVLELE